MREIQTSLLPFHLHKKTITVPEGVTLEQMVKFVMPSSVEGVDIVVNIGDSVVPEELWKTIRPKNNAMVGINIVPAGGGGGSTGRKILATIVSIVIVAVSFFFAPQTAGGSLSLLGYLTVGAGSVVASLAYSMIAGIPKQNARGGRAGGDISESPTQFVEGSTNAINRYGVVPANLGVNRMFPPQAALPFTETSGNDQYSRQLFTYGYGNITLSDIKIGETLITEFTGVQLQHKLSSDLSDGVSLYPSDYFQESLSILLEQADGYATRTTQQNVDEFEIDITFQQGLVNYDDAGARQNATVELQAEYRVTGSGGGFTALSPTTVTNATGEAVRVSIRAVLPAQNQYDVRIKRNTSDSVSTRILDKVHWTALKNVTYGAPVLKEGISGTALRILATDQLNGTVDRFNAVVSTSILNYDNGSSWETGISSNPAAIYRYVLQSPAFIKNLANARIDVDALEDWSDYCALKGLTYNRVVDYETSIDDLLNDIAASGMATPHKVHGTYGVIVDNERPVIKGMVTPRNSWNYKGNINYPEIPHGLRVEFRNPTIGYETDERIVYADGYTAANATLLERLQFTSCTDPEAAYYYARLYLASAKLQPETHTFKMDIENLSFNRGDRIVFVNDTILVGVGQGRIKELVYDNPDSPTTVVSVVIDDFITIPSASNFAARIRHDDASGFNYYALTTSVGETNTLTFTTPIAVASAPGIGSLCSFVEDGLELDLLIKDIKLDKNVNASITAINYAPARFDAATGVIPAFNSNVTLPADVFEPFAPQSGGAILSDETVMSRNSDGSFITRMIIPLLNINTIGVEPVVKIRVTGSTTWTKPDLLSSSPQKVVLTGLQDSTNYDVHVFYQSQTGSRLISKALQLNSTFFTGAGGNPASVSGFKVSVHEGIGYFEWTVNSEIDLSHYFLRFTGLTTGATWETSQTLAADVRTNRVSFPIQIGTYLIKAIDLSGNESDTATTILSGNSGNLINVVENLSGQTGWTGTKVNTQVEGTSLTLIDTSSTGYYYYPQIDVGAVYQSVISSSILAVPTEFLNIRSVAVIRDTAVIRGASGTLIRSFGSIRDLTSVRGITPDIWSVTLEMRQSDDNITFTAWEEFINGSRSFRYIEFRLVLTSSNVNVTPKVSAADVSVDMPDRYETGEDVDCPIGGATVVYGVAFKNNPSVNITLQNGNVDDKIEFISKTNTGFVIKVYNNAASGYVARSFDFISAGYGRTS